MDREIAAAERGFDERADCATADLSGAVDVERMHGHRRQPELVVVRMRHVLAGELRHRVRPPRLADAADRRYLPLADVEGMGSEDLARREVDEALKRVLCRKRRLERVVRPDDVHTHRPHRAFTHRVHARDTRAMDNVRRSARELLHRVEVEDVRLVELEVRMLGERSTEQGVAVEVVQRNDVVCIDQAACKRRRDKAGAACDEDPFSA